LGILLSLLRNASASAVPPCPPERHAGEPPIVMAAAEVAAFDDDDDDPKLAPAPLSVATMAIRRQAQTRKKTNASSLPQHSTAPGDLSGPAPI
jgi:hypothetical protein